MKAHVASDIFVIRVADANRHLPWFLDPERQQIPRRVCDVSAGAVHASPAPGDDPARARAVARAALVPGSGP